MSLISFLSALLLSAHASPAPDFTSLHCEAFDRSMVVTAEAQDCQDSRYLKWNRKGCYRVKASQGQTLILDKEMLRDFVSKESHQGFYALYSYDNDTWILNGMIIRLTENKGGGHEFRLDQRGQRKEHMLVLARGLCEIN